jgi:PPOX class probable F420-dependent enzyme
MAPSDQFSEKAKEFLAGKHFGKFASVKGDGSPHVTPIWYMYEGGKLLVNMTKQRVKYKNILKDPRVCFLIDDGYPYVIVFGKARVATERDPFKDIEALAIRYTGEENGRKRSMEYFSKQDRVSVEIIPEKILEDL